MIEIIVNGQSARTLKSTNIVSGAINARTIKYIFNADWDGLSKIIQFQNGETVLELIMEVDTIIMPAEVLAQAGYLYTRAYGVTLDELNEIVETRITSSPTIFRINESGLIDMTLPYPVTPSMYEQLLGIATQARDDAAQTAPLRDETRDLRDEAQAAGVISINARDSALRAEAGSQLSLTQAQTAEATAEQHALEALNNKLNGIEAHDTNIASHPSIISDIRNVEAIARGRATAYVFNTKADMDAWLLMPENTDLLVVGDNLYIRDTGVKDYWWDGESAQELEAEAPDLTDYYLKTQVDAMMPITISRTDYDVLVALGQIEAGRVYDIYEV